MPGTLYSGSFPHQDGTSFIANIPLTNISLGVAGPPYSWSPYTYLESRALGVDRLGQKVYVALQYYRSDEGGEVSGVFSFNYDGSERTKIMDRNWSSWGGITISQSDSGRRKIYFTEGNAASQPNSNGTILKRANLDGSGTETLIYPEKMACRIRNSTADNCPKAAAALDQVTLDEGSGFMYWATDFPAGIYRARIETPAGQTAEDRTDIEAIIDRRPAQMKIAGHFLYWVEGSQVWRLDVSDRGSAPETIVSDTTAFHSQPLGGIAVNEEGGAIWVVAESGVAKMWRVSSDGKEVAEYQLGDGMWVNGLNGFEVV
jgi:hypothetical protein